MPYNTICYQKLSESKPSMTTLGICRCGGNQTSQDLMRLLNVFPMCCGAALKVFSMCWVWLKIMSHVFFAEKHLSSKNRRTDWKPCLLCCFSLNTCRKVIGCKKIECRFQRAMLWLLWYIIIVHSDIFFLICYILITSGDTKDWYVIFWSHLEIPRAVMDYLWNLLPRNKKNSCRIHLYIPGSRSVRWFYSYKMFWTYKMLCLG